MGTIGDSPSGGAGPTASAAATVRQALVRASADTTQQTGIYAWRIKSSSLGPVELGLESGGKELFRQAIVHRKNTFMILQREGGKGGDAFTFKLDPNRKATKVVGIQSEFMKTAAARMAVDLQRSSGNVTANFDQAGSCLSELKDDVTCAGTIAACALPSPAQVLGCIGIVPACGVAIEHSGPCMSLFICEGPSCTLDPNATPGYDPPPAVGDNGVPIDDGADGGSSDDGADAGSPDDTGNGDDQGSDECTPDPSCNPCISSCECADPDLTCTDTSGGSDGDESSGGGC
jgi:hypothetical protein